VGEQDAKKAAAGHRFDRLKIVRSEGFVTLGWVDVSRDGRRAVQFRQLERWPI